MYEDLLQFDRDQPAKLLHLICFGELEDWLAMKPQRFRKGVEAAGFAGTEPGIAIIPGDNVSDWEVVIAVRSATLDTWDLAPAAQQLPEGTYRIAAGASPGAAALGWMLAHYRFDRYRRADTNIKRRVLLTPDASAIDTIVSLARAIALIRDLVNMPANDFGPAELALATRKEGEVFGADVSVIEGADLLPAGFPAVHAVGRSAARAPCLIDLRWGDPSHPKLVLVGKGVCFDSGGINIKQQAEDLLLMKKDMGGAAHALALGRLVMEHKLPVRLRLLIPAVENAVSADAYRPGDIIVTRKGLSVEVGDTDAEGRLILCDALAAADEESPALILDFATLTGAARVALGDEIAALFTNDDDLAEKFNAAASTTDDPVWRLPLWSAYRKLLKSEFADTSNVGAGRGAGAITAALFLENFISHNRRWAHLDIHAWNAEARPGRPKGGDATGLRASWALLQGLFGLPK